MLVILLMARIAIRLGIFVFERLVTFLALGPEVFAQERELRLVVIEPNVILPALF